MTTTKTLWAVGGSMLFLSTVFFQGGTQAANLLPVSACETEMITAFSAADTALYTKFPELMNAAEVTAVGKSQEIVPYMRTYDCQTEAICFAIKNPNPETVIPTGMNECGNLGTVGDLQSALQADFSQCSTQFIHETALLYDRCETFLSYKKSGAREYIADQFTEEVSLENQSLLGAKILDIQQKMDVLLEKTRTLSVSFTKIINDINCTIGTPSHTRS